jgi:hypothetical protein
MQRALRARGYLAKTEEDAASFCVGAANIKRNAFAHAALMLHDISPPSPLGMDTGGLREYGEWSTVRRSSRRTHLAPGNCIL